MRLSINYGPRFLAVVVVGALCGGMVLSACSGSAVNVGGKTGVVRVVAAENFWGSIASQVGGSHVAVTSLIANAEAAPHDYEPTAADARTVAEGQYIIVNGAGYDPWLDKLLEANPVKGRQVLDIGKLVGKKEGDNPHLWYSPDYVKIVARKIRDDLKSIDAADAAALDASAEEFLTTGLWDYTALMAEIKTKYGGTKVGATESIFSYLAPILGLDILTPASYLNAVSEGTDISASDYAAVERQIDQKQIAILIYNSQNTPGNVEALLKRANAKGIPVATITETMVPEGATFQEWQVEQLKGIRGALQQAMGK